MTRNWISRLAVLAVALAACSETKTESLDRTCLTEGRCACRANVECTGGKICIDGQCVVQADTAPDSTFLEVTAPSDTGNDSDTTISAGEFMAPCTLDGDCFSGHCVLFQGDARVCTRACVDACPDGWHCKGVASGTGIEFLCEPERERLCEPCTTDRACPGSGALCVALGADAGAVCGLGCETTACPDGYTCSEIVSVDGAAGKECMPTSGQCECTPEAVGSAIPCRADNAFGSCYGTRTCGAGGALGACMAPEPAAETCNGRDDDCNGFTDDAIPVVDCTHTNDFGTCRGSLLCVPEAGAVCTAAVPAAELCDARDNDCDGATDEDFRGAGDVPATLEHCGACGVDCRAVFPEAVAVACDTAGAGPHCAITECPPGLVKVSDSECGPAPDRLCEPCTTDAVCGGPHDLCLSLDATDARLFCGRDCGADNLYGAGCPEGYRCDEKGAHPQCVPDNGSCDCTAANAGQIKPCTMSNAAGTCFGLAVCDPAAGWTACSAKTPVSETCNAQDDDCDGVTDDGLGGVGCERSNDAGTCSGITVCDPSAGEFFCAAPDAQPELCNSLDDDCNGLTDDPFAWQVTNAAGEVVGLKYGKTDANCGACGRACAPSGLATETHCDATGLEPFCRIAACAAGYYPQDGRACVPIPSGNLCLPCTVDADCRGPGDRCLSGPEGHYCGRDCAPGSIYDGGADGACSDQAGVQGCCPSGFACDAGQCQRPSHDCSCDVTGKLRACTRANGFGTCGGVETCSVARGWSECSAQVPAAEICNGVDDDCDGRFDLADPDIDTSALAGYPNCERVSDACTGVWTCASVAGTYDWQCSARVPSDEACNGRDDDCDGTTDNGFVDASGLYTQLENCGQCGLDCRAAIAHADNVRCGLLDGAPTCLVDSCDVGYTPFPPEAGAARACLPLEAANCRPCTSASDCGTRGDQCIAVGSDAGHFCAQRCDAAAPYAGCTGAVGTQDCCAAGYTCRELDEDAGGGKVCVPSNDSCQCSAGRAGAIRACDRDGNDGQTRCYGVERCSAGAGGGGGYGWSACDLGANVEVCDGLDNNCDGTVDEGFRTGGVYTADANCGSCGHNCGLAFSEGLHALGACLASAELGPHCGLAECTTGVVGSGTACRVAGDCTGGASCDPVRHACVRACATDAVCGAGQRCVGGACATACANSPACVTAYGEGAVCTGGVCVSAWDYTDLDSGEGNGCECPALAGGARDVPDIFASYPAPGDVYVDRDCDGIDGELGAALFVRADEVGGDGSLGAPFGSIQAAIDAFGTPAHSGARHILVATGVYVERVTVKAGVQVFGGYSDDFTRRDIALFPTVIAPLGTQVDAALPGALNAVGIDSTTMVAGFTIEGPDASAAGASSYAVYLRNSTGAFTLAQSTVLGGRGAPGAAGGLGGPGSGGVIGGNGLPSKECVDHDCSNQTEHQNGAAGGTNAACVGSAGCPGMESEAGEDTQTADTVPAGCSYGRGGDRGRYRNADASLCKYDFTPGGNQVGTSGGDGSSGGGGTAGAGCSSGVGSVNATGWVGASAGGGAGGGSGTGGMGGAAGGWAINEKTSACTIPGPGKNFGDLGGSGGGGGAGGCGGGGGLPGGPGGASFAIFVVPRGGGASFPTLDHNVIVRGSGGAGGAGGNGGTGGPGGRGGSGGTAGWPAWGAGIGGNGGRGGDGGAGGGGGGGCGGAAYGVAGAGLPTATIGAANTFVVGDGVATGGAGGVGGLSAGTGAGTAGVAGDSRNLKAF